VAYRLTSAEENKHHLAHLPAPGFDGFPCVELLVGDIKQIIPKQFVTLLSQEEIEEILES
jgi:hypothetical protein